MLHHYVFIKYQADTLAEHIQTFCQKMLALPASIVEIQQLEIGHDVLHDERSWDLMLIMQFESIAALRSYQQHTEHQAAAQFNSPHVANVGSLDCSGPGKVPA